jgi:cytochrome P450
MRADRSLTVDPFDFKDKERLRRLLPKLRRSCPVAALPTDVLLVTRYDDVLSVLKDNEAFANANAARAPGVTVPAEDRLFFFEYDPPEHLQLRRMLLDLLARTRVQRDVEVLRALTTRLLRPLLAQGRGEFVTDFAVPVAGEAMMHVAGLPPEDAPLFRAWISDIAISGFSFTNQNGRGVGMAECYPELLEYLDRHDDARESLRDRPDDVLTRVVTARLGDRPLPRSLRRMIVLSVIAGGNNTMVNLFGNILLTLARRPDLFDALDRDRSLVPVAVEESLRRDSPSMFITRLCRHDTDLGGVPVRQGQRVMIHLLSANQDERRFANPTDFRLDRQGGPAHVAFGWGAHLCLGAPIARTLASCLLDTVLDAVESISLTPGSDPGSYGSAQGHGPAALDLLVTPRHRKSRPSRPLAK